MWSVACGDVHDACTEEDDSVKPCGSHDGLASQLLQSRKARSKTAQQSGEEDNHGGQHNTDNGQQEKMNVTKFSEKKEDWFISPDAKVRIWDMSGKHVFERNACELTGYDGKGECGGYATAGRGLWTLDQLPCGDGLCLKSWGGGCSPGEIEIPKGIKVDLIWLWGSWNGVCRYGPKQIFHTFHGTGGKVQTKKGTCAFRFRADDTIGASCKCGIKSRYFKYVSHDECKRISWGRWS